MIILIHILKSLRLNFVSTMDSFDEDGYLLLSCWDYTTLIPLNYLLKGGVSNFLSFENVKSFPTFSLLYIVLTVIFISVLDLCCRLFIEFYFM